MAPYAIRKVTLSNESEGPEYFTTGEFQVVDESNGAVVARFGWSLEEPYLTNASYSGPDRVVLSDDGSEAVAIYAPRHEERVLLPHATGPVVVSGLTIDADTDFGALVREIARNDAPPDLNGWREPAGQWLSKLYTRLGQTVMAQRLVAEIAALQDAEDEPLRACASRFYYFLPGAPGAIVEESGPA